MRTHDSPPPAPAATGTGEEGAISLLSAMVALVVLLALALAVDLGSAALAERDMQGAVDLAALDAVLALAEDGTDDLQARAQELAEQSLGRNPGWSDRSGRDVVATVGTFDRASRTFTPTTDAPDAVLVTGTAPAFERLTGVLPGTDVVAHTAVAMLDRIGAIGIGTNVASLDTARSAVLSQLMGAFLGGPVTLDAAGWQGLADGSVPLGVLAAELNVGSVEQLVDTRVTAAQLLDATISGLTASGDPLDLQAATILGTFASSVDNSTTFAFGDLVAVEQGAGTAVAGAEVDAFSLVTGTATVINGDNVVSSDLDLSDIPGVTSGTIDVAVIEPMQFAVGRPGLDETGTYRTLASTGQVRVALDLVLDPVGEFAGIGVGTVRLPIGVDLGQGTAGFASVGCDPDESLAHIVNDVTTSAARLAYGATTDESLLTPSAQVYASVQAPLVDLTVDTLLSGEVPVASVGATGTHDVPGVDELVTITGPFANSVRVAGVNPLGDVGLDGVGLSALLEDLDLTTTLEPLDTSLVLGGDVSVDLFGASAESELEAQVVTPALTEVIGPVVDQVDAAVFGTLVDVLGVGTLADADTTGQSLTCSARRLVD